MQDIPAVNGAFAPEDVEQEQAHLTDYLRVLSARRWTVIGTFAIFVVVALAWVVVQTPIYQARARLQIEPAKVNLTDFKAVYDPTLGGLGGQMARREYMETQYRLVVCRPLLERTFSRFNFDKLPEFREMSDPTKAFGEFFSVEPERRSRLVWVKFEWKDPDKAAEVLDFHVREYIADYRRRTLGVTRDGLKALEEKARELQPKVAAASDALGKFMAIHASSSLESPQSVEGERLAELSRSCSEIRRRRVELDSIVKNIESALRQDLSPEDVPEVTASAAIRDLKIEYIRAKQLSSDLGGRFGPRHPEVVAVKARLEAISERLRLEIRSIYAAVRAERDRAIDQEEALVRELKEQDVRVVEFKNLARQYAALKSSYEATNGTYNSVMRRIEEINFALASGGENETIHVITPPWTPVRPVRPRKTMTVGMAGVLGVIFGVALCFFLEYLDTTLKTKEEVERLLRAPVIGFVPALREEDHGEKEGEAEASPELMALAHPRSAVAEAFRSIRTALAFSSADAELRHLLVTSASPSEGKTLVSVNIAQALAQAGKRVLLVDADMRRPRIHKIFEIPSRPGLSNLLAGEGAGGIDDVARAAGGIDGLQVMSAGPLPPNPAELLGSARMRELLEEMGDRFDTVVFDTPPAAHVTDAIVLCQYVHGVVLVVRCFTTQREMARRSRDLIAQAHGRLLGVVLNNVDVPRGAYSSYYYRQYYYYYYGEGGHRRKRGRRSKRRRSGDETTSAPAEAEAGHGRAT